jgi:ubiquinone/menaquinone biosynthesis C-methylase UbiE
MFVAGRGGRERSVERACYAGLMLRILEPEVMDTAQDAKEYDAMDLVEANTRFAEDALALLDPSAASIQVLDIGTGTAQIPVLMLDRDKRIQVLAVDLADEMLRVATDNVAKAGYGSQCRLAKLDAKALRVPDRRYDLVVCNSTAHHIPEPLTLFTEIARIVRPGGAILVRDLIRPPTMDEAWAIVKRVAAGERMRQQQLFFDSLCAALTLDEVKSICVSARLGDLHVARVSDRHWTAERRMSWRLASRGGSS